MNDGKKKKISPRSRQGPEPYDGKEGPSTSRSAAKKPSKYTIVREQKDIDQLEKLRRILKDTYGMRLYNTDSELYRNLPRLYLDAVKQNQDLINQVDELTAKLDQLEDLKASFRRIFMLCGVEK